VVFLISIAIIWFTWFILILCDQIMQYLLTIVNQICDQSSEATWKIIIGPCGPTKTKHLTAMSHATSHTTSALMAPGGRRVVTNMEAQP
jgi:hypothetical protein